MDRYDLVLNKKVEERKIDVENTSDDDIKVIESPIPMRGKVLHLCGPNGYQVAIPVRYIEVSENDTQDGNELCLKIPLSVAKALKRDINGSKKGI
jgi:hypothetical protein